MIVFEAALSGKSIGHGKNVYYFGESAELSTLDTAKAIGETLHKLEKIGSPDPKPYTAKEEQKYVQVR
jgi:hypothetical protein